MPLGNKCDEFHNFTIMIFIEGLTRRYACISFPTEYLHLTEGRLAFENIIPLTTWYNTYFRVFYNISSDFSDRPDMTDELLTTNWPIIKMEFRVMFQIDYLHLFFHNIHFDVIIMVYIDYLTTK